VTQFEVASDNEKRGLNGKTLEQIQEPRKGKFKYGIIFKCGSLIEAINRRQRPKSIEIDVNKSGGKGLVGWEHGLGSGPLRIICSEASGLVLFLGRRRAASPIGAKGHDSPFAGRIIKLNQLP